MGDNPVEHGFYPDYERCCRYNQRLSDIVNNFKKGKRNRTKKELCYFCGNEVSWLLYGIFETLPFNILFLVSAEDAKRVLQFFISGETEHVELSLR
jgi:hypothetical protein